MCDKCCPDCGFELKKTGKNYFCKKCMVTFAAAELENSGLNKWQ